MFKKMKDLFLIFHPPKIEFLLAAKLHDHFANHGIMRNQSIITSFCYAKAKHKKKFIMKEREKADLPGSVMMMEMMVLVELMILKMMMRIFFGGLP